MLPAFTMRQLLEAGVHFGHQSHRWNPKMSSYIFGTRNNIHIVDLTQTTPLLHQALVKVSDTVAKGGRVLFVGTKRQASDSIADAATRSAQYFMNHRWLGGTLTNWKTISLSIRRLRQLEEIAAGDGTGRTKKELLNLTREREKLSQSLGGIKEMGGTPDLLFVIDTNKEAIAIAEARKLNIPIVAIIDTNCDPDGIDFPIPGNDDAGRAITLYCDLIARAALDGIARGQAQSGVDMGASEAPALEELPDAAAPAAAAAAPAAPAAAAAAPEAAAPAVAARFEGIEAPRGDADDLKLVAGIDERIQQQLSGLGVYHYWQIADLDEANLALLAAELKMEPAVIKEADWIESAKKLVAANAA